MGLETGIYLRVSTEEQAQEGFSIRAQEQKLRDYARIKDWPIFNVYSDEGISGKDIAGRPAIKEMIADIEAGLVKNALVFKIDRLTRSTADLIYLVDLFNKYDCAFNSLMESIDTQTASGRMFLKIIGIFAEFERENIIERTKVGVERKVKEGYSLGGVSSYGYSRAKDQKIQTINEGEAAIVREIFDMYVEEGFNLTDIARRLNLRGVKTKGDKAWDSTKVRRLMQNVNYIGNVRHHIRANNEAFYEGLHEAFIPQELFDRAQGLLAKNKKTVAKRPPKGDNYFAGFLVCEFCGYRLKTYNTRKKLKTRYLYSSGYCCGNRTLKTCTCGSMSHKKVEDAISAYISHIADFDIDISAMELQREENDNANIAAAQIFESKLKTVDAKEKETMGLFASNDISFEEYREIKKQLDSDRLIINTEIERLKQETGDDIPGADVVLCLKQNWEKLDNAGKRLFLREFVEKIIISSEKPEKSHYGTVKIKEIEFL